MLSAGVEPWAEVAREDASDDTLARTAHGDRQAFAELYRRYVDPIYRYMRYQVPDEEAKDLTSQVFFQAYRASEQFRGESTYRSWLFRIAHNAVVSHHRSRKSVPLPVAEVPDVADATADLGGQASEADDARTLWDAVQELNPYERELVEMRFVEDLSPKEIAHVTGHSAGAVRVRIHRVLRRLRRRLEEKGMER